MYYPRTLRAFLSEASEQFPVLLLTGPRQVGKTTLLQQAREEGRIYVSLDDPTLRALAVEDPVLFLQRFPPPNLIDEIQYAPSLFPYIKLGVDTQRQTGMFWLTGSQQFHLMKDLSETLAGRVAIVQLLGFSGRERHRIDLEVPPFLPVAKRLAAREASVSKTTLRRVYADIWTGSFPALVAGPVKNRDLFYGSYLQTYLQRDVRELAQVGDEAAFLRFLKSCAARTAQMLNLSDLARDADVSVNTAKRWLSVLRTSGQVYLLEPYHSNVTKRLVKRPKLYFLDTGLCAYLTDWSSPETLEAGAMSGAVFESYVFAEILKSWWHCGQFPQVYYYRNRDGKEIDILFAVDGKLFPVEIKKSATPRRDWGSLYSLLKEMNQPIGAGAVLCLCRESIPIRENLVALPVGIL